MTRIPRLGLLAVPALAVGVWWLSRREPAPVMNDLVPGAVPGVSAATEAERARLREEVRQLSLEAAQLRAARAQTATSDAAAIAAVADSNAGAGAAGRDRPTPEMEAKWMLARAALLDEALAAQPRDETWAADIEARTRTMYAGHEGIKLVSMKCRATACRMELSYADARARIKHLQSLADDFADLPRIMYAYPGEPEIHTAAILHMAQREHPLPQLEYAKFAAGRTTAGSQ